jgi:hypothetical protein
MANPDLSVFGRQKRFADFERENEEFAARKRQAAMQEQLGQLQMQKMQKEIESGVATNDPAALRLANEYLAAKQSGDIERANAIEAFAKTREKNVMLTADGRYVPLGGMPEALGSLEFGKNYGGETATQQVRSQYEPSRAADIESAKYQATSMQEAMSNLPKIEDQSKIMKDLIDEISAHPGLSAVVGMPNPLKGRIPLIGNVVGSPAADFQAKIDQLGGKQFLEAFETLKGGGQITEVEGTKATNAIAAMQTSQTEKQFKEELQKLKEVVDIGLQRARNKIVNDPLAASQRAVMQRIGEGFDNPNMTIPGMTLDQFNEPVQPMGNIPMPTGPTPGAPARGSVENGYMYMGGDPANKDSWKKVK